MSMLEHAFPRDISLLQQECGLRSFQDTALCLYLFELFAVR